MKLKTKDTVMIIKGKDIGKTGTIERINKKTDKVIVSGLNIYKKHGKPTKKNPKGGIIDVSMPIPSANIMIICPHCKKPSKIGYKINDSKNKMRICKKCKDQIS